MTVNKLTIKEIYTKDEIELLSDCTLCPHQCRVNRFEEGSGYCGADAGMNIASICIHRGEEPSISGPEGICNIFFSGCNLKCLFCQNYEISRPGRERRRGFFSYEGALDAIVAILSQGIKAVGFVSPSHVVPQVTALIRGLNKRGLKPITVYNSNSYDKKETLRALEGIIDVYLPDYKYVSAGLSNEFSDACDYPEVAFRAIKEMYYQKGSALTTDEKGRAESGMLIRHLVLPCHAEESQKVLRTIAEEISTGVHLSLMSQYTPTPLVRNHTNLGRALYKDEYEDVVNEMGKLGFRNGWVQDMESNRNYCPDFSRENPFG